MKKIIISKSEIPMLDDKGNYIAGKRCNDCMVVYPATHEFFRRKCNQLDAYCKVCRLERNRNYKVLKQGKDQQQ